MTSGRRLASKARSSTVTTELLVTSSYLGPISFINNARYTNDPLISYLFEEEQPHYIFTSEKKGVKYGQERKVKPKSPGRRSFTIVTDKRVIAVVGLESTDYIISIPLDSIDQVSYTSGSRFTGYSTIEVETEENHYEIFAKNRFSIVTKEDVQEAVNYIRSYDRGPQPELEEHRYRERPTSQLEDTSSTSEQNQTTSTSERNQDTDDPIAVAAGIERKVELYEDKVVISPKEEKGGLEGLLMQEKTKQIPLWQVGTVRFNKAERAFDTGVIHFSKSGNFEEPTSFLQKHKFLNHENTVEFRPKHSSRFERLAKSFYELEQR